MAGSILFLAEIDKIKENRKEFRALKE